jgi:hypothetical protein
MQQFMYKRTTLMNTACILLHLVKDKDSRKAPSVLYKTQFNDFMLVGTLFTWGQTERKSSNSVTRISLLREEIKVQKK